MKRPVYLTFALPLLLFLFFLHFSCGSNPTPAAPVTVYVNPTPSIPAGTGATWTETAAAAPWTGRQWPYCYNFQNALWVVGGDNTAGVTNDVWTSTDGTNWTQVTQTHPFTAEAFGSNAVFNGQMYVIGGSLPSTSNEVWRTSDGANWTQAVASGSATFSPRGNQGTAVYQGKLWVVGGYTTVAMNDVYSSADGANWTQVSASSNLPARYICGLLTYNNALWAIGGIGNSGSLNDVWTSTDGAHWTVVNPNAEFSPRYGHQCLVYDNAMWVIGAVASIPLTDAWYSFDGNIWTEATPSSGGNFTPSRYPGSTVYNNHMWLFGGCLIAPPTFYSDVWYSP